MTITSREEYETATTRLRALSDASEGSPAATEVADLVQAVRAWDDDQPDTSHGPEDNPEPGTNVSPDDDLSFSGLPAIWGS